MKIKKLIFLDISQQLMCNKGTQHRKQSFLDFTEITCDLIKKKIVFFFVYRIVKVTKKCIPL